MLSLGQFEGAYDDLWAWLTGAVKQLEEFEPITGDPDAVAAQLAKHKVWHGISMVVRGCGTWTIQEAWYGVEEELVKGLQKGMWSVIKIFIL